jgi:catechol 2,3-dioxygenase-like lactoylglutathione lyase family enzyme
MSVIGLNHVNIRSRDVLASAEFYAKLLGLSAKPGPMATRPEQSQWLFDANNQPIIHLRQYDTPPGPTGPIDHIALSCTDVDGMIARLEALNIEFGRFDGLGITQLFLKDLHGVAIELQFVG